MTFRELHGCDVCFREDAAKPTRELKLTWSGEIAYLVHICDRLGCWKAVAEHLEAAPFRNIARGLLRVAESRCEVPMVCGECSPGGPVSREPCLHCNGTREEPGTGKPHTVRPTRG